jgi:RNA polymerase-binding transcription factor DksA
MPKKLTPAELKTYEGILQHMLSVLSGDINQLEQEALGQGEVRTESQGDGGADSYAQEFSLELLEHEETTMREVVEALERVREETYGRCEACNAWLRRERLKAVPHARKCIDCKRDEEVSGG